MVQLEELLKTGNPEILEVRPAATGLPANIFTTCSAFANTAGGVIVLGAERDRETGMYHVTGAHGCEKMILDLWKMLDDPGRFSSNIFFKDHIYVKEISGREVVVIEVPRADRKIRPVFTGRDVFSGSYRRSTTGDRKCTREEIRTMLREQEVKSDDSRLLWRWNLAALDFSTLERYRQVFARQRPQHPWNGMEDEEFLVRSGAAGRGEDRRLHPTLGGVIFFGEKEAILQELPRYSLDYRELLPDGSGWASRIASGDSDWSGNLFDFYCRIIDRMTEPMGNMLREPRSSALAEILTRAGDGMGEILCNALIHADYRGSGGIVVDRGRDWTSISNSGTFLSDPADALCGTLSEPRNDVLSRLFALIHVGSRAGGGIASVLQTWKDLGLKRPQITENFEAGRVTVILEHKETSLVGCAARLSKARKEKAAAETDEAGCEKAGTEDSEKKEAGAAEADAADAEREEGSAPEADAADAEREEGSAAEADAADAEREEGSAPEADAADKAVAGGNSRGRMSAPVRYGYYGNPDRKGVGIDLAFLDEDEMTPVDERVLAAVKKNVRITVKELADSLEISMSTVNRSLKHLKKLGKLRRFGATRGRWIIVESGIVYR